MTAVRKKLVAILLCMVTLLAGIALLTSCKKNDKADDLKVTFMVEDDESSEWKQTAEYTAENGEVELPTVSRQYYTFANWYENKEFSGAPFTGKNVTKSLTVYARFIPVEVNVHINGVDQGTQNLIDVVKGTYNPGEGLEFDGWYTNANYTTKWDNKAETNDLYAKSVARITFNDGYQDVYTTTVNPGAVYESPVTHEAKTEDGAVSTVEKALIWKNYMSAYDISYVNADGTAFDFGAPIGIYRYVSKSTAGEGDSAYTVWDVQFVSSAGGYNANQNSCSIYLGDISDKANIVRYEVMEGAYYYFSEETNLYIQSVSKIHANAFTACEEERLSSIRYSPVYMGSAISKRQKLSALVHDENCASVFEEGWYAGYTDDGLGSMRMSAL